MANKDTLNRLDEIENRLEYLENLGNLSVQQELEQIELENEKDRIVNYLDADNEEYFKLGDFVKVASDNDNDGYNSFRDKKLMIVHVATNTKEHPGYDDSMEGMPLYDLHDAKTGENVGCSLYYYELESWE